MQTPIKETLIKVRELLSTPDHWTKGVTARDCHGSQVMTLEHTACAFCLTGALWKVGNHYETRPDEKLFEVLAQAIGDVPLEYEYDPDAILSYQKKIELWNDDSKTKFSDVVAMLDKAIQNV